MSGFTPDDRLDSLSPSQARTERPTDKLTEPALSQRADIGSAAGPVLGGGL